jgi:ubiquinone/menaquinone biosynthesis C-methylase UbiE
MVRDKKIRVCPVERAGVLDLSPRRWFQNPQKILTPHVKEGMTVLDFGCGPGFFTIDLAKLVGKSGRVIATDLQEGMLDRLRKKIQEKEFQNRILLRKSDADKIGWSEKVDFILVFYVLHEVPDQEAFFKQAAAIFKPKGQLLIVEPPFHVSQSAFEETIRRAQNTGFRLKERPKVLFNKTALLEKAD